MKWTVGPEDDDALWDQLGDALRALGFSIRDEWWGLGETTEISHWDVVSPDGTLVVDAETYIGITVEGADELVGRVQAEFERGDPRLLRGGAE